MEKSGKYSENYNASTLPNSKTRTVRQLRLL
jgi:hypothetical protein